MTETVHTGSDRESWEVSDGSSTRSGGECCGMSDEKDQGVTGALGSE